MSNLIEVKNLVKSFGSLEAVKSISFNVKKGEILGFLGPNGAGKTTTMRMLAGYLRPNFGHINICGEDALKKIINIQEKMGYLPEGAPLYEDMTPIKFLNFMADIRKLRGQKRQKRIDFVVGKLQLFDVLEQKIDTLSKGYKRRVAMAQAILHDPQILILDEPTDGLDPNQKAEVRDLILSMKKDKAIIISTHILEDFEALCDRAVVIADGQIVAKGTPEEIAAKSPNYNSVVITTVDTSSNKILNDILQIKQVERVTVKDEKKVVAYAKDGYNILPQVASVVREKQAAIAELYARRDYLSEAFSLVTNSVSTTKTPSKKAPAPRTSSSKAKNNKVKKNNSKGKVSNAKKKVKTSA